MLNRTWIESRIPHKAAMCLLHAVESHTEDEIVCCAISHRSPDNPLRDDSGLGIVTGIEYAAQAMAVHGVLREGANRSSRRGYLVTARDVSWSVQRLDLVDAPLTIRAQRLSGADSTIMYRFSIHAGEDEILSGRATVVLDAASLEPSIPPNRS